MIHQRPADTTLKPPAFGKNDLPTLLHSEVREDRRGMNILPRMNVWVRVWERGMMGPQAVSNNGRRPPHSSLRLSERTSSQSYQYPRGQEDECESFVGFEENSDDPRLSGTYSKGIWYSGSGSHVCICQPEAPRRVQDTSNENYTNSGWFFLLRISTNWMR